MATMKCKMSWLKWQMTVIWPCKRIIMINNNKLTLNKWITASRRKKSNRAVIKLAKCTKIRCVNQRCPLIQITTKWRTWRCMIALRWRMIRYRRNQIIRSMNKMHVKWQLRHYNRMHAIRNLSKMLSSKANKTKKSPNKLLKLKAQINQIKTVKHLRDKLNYWVIGTNPCRKGSKV